MISNPSSGRCRPAFTLIEMLVVLAIIAAVVAISIPAVMKAREAANRMTCANNLKQWGTACYHHQEHIGYLPTAGRSDISAPVFYTNSTGNYQPIVGWKQDAGWAYQCLPYMDAENIWSGGSAPTTATAALTAVLQKPIKYFFCPSRRTLTTTTYTASNFPEESAYSSLKGTKFNVVACDYAGCNGNGALDAQNNLIQNGMVLSQFGANGAYVRNTIQTSDVTDGLAYTLFLGEKACNVLKDPITNEDDMGYAAGFSGTNFNVIRLTSSNLLPLHDFEVTGPTGGAFGSPHATAWNALFGDGSVRPLNYNIDATVYAAIGTTKGREDISDTDLGF
jgi:prepilin-type N-terminal cleavage/methylation domain-containing protein